MVLLHSVGPSVLYDLHPFVSRSHCLEDLTTIHTDTDSSFNEKLKLNAGSGLIIVAITEVKLDFQIRDQR